MDKRLLVFFLKAAEIIGRRVDGFNVRSISVRGCADSANFEITTRTEIQASGSEYNHEGYDFGSSLCRLSKM